MLCNIFVRNVKKILDKFELENVRPSVANKSELEGFFKNIFFPNISTSSIFHIWDFHLSK